MNINNVNMVLITHCFPINIFVLLISEYEPQVQECATEMCWTVIFLKHLKHGK